MEKSKEDKLKEEIEDACEAFKESKTRTEFVGNLWLALAHWTQLFNRIG